MTDHVVLPAEWPVPEPPPFRDCALDGDGLRGWRLRLQEPDIPAWAEVSRRMQAIQDRFAGLRQLPEAEAARQVIDQFDQLWPDLVAVGARLVVLWNFLDRDGKPRPQPYGNPQAFEGLGYSACMPLMKVFTEFYTFITAGAKTEAEAKN